MALRPLTKGIWPATIDWGDGTGPSPGTVSGPKGGPFTVSGSHTYSTGGTYTLNVSLYDTVDNTTYQASPGSAQVNTNYLLTVSTSGSGTVRHGQRYQLSRHMWLFLPRQLPRESECHADPWLDLCRLEWSLHRNRLLQLSS